MKQEESLPPLCWRSDPKSSFSDWQIRLVHGTDEWIYHVHKCVLACGPRGSHYFSRIFQNDGFAESQEQQSTIEMEHKEAALAFELMLDFMYYNDPIVGDLSDVKSLVALHHLGEYFSVSALQEFAFDLLEPLLPSEPYKAHHYANRFKSDAILYAVGRSLYDSGNWCRLLTREIYSVRAWMGLQRALVFDRFDLAPADRRKASEQWSREVASLYDRGHGLAIPIERSVFDDFISEKAMPFVAVDAVAALLGLDFILNDGSEGQRGPSSSLLWRCTAAVRESKRVPTFSEQDRDILRELPTETLVSLLCSVTHKPFLSPETKEK